MKEILLLGKGISNNALHQFMLKYSIEHDYLKEDEVIDCNYSLVIKGPGLYYDTKVLKRFIELGIEVITDIEFIYWFLNKEYIGITGTNGKTTTTYLITEIINQKYTAVACGNCGFPIAQAALDYKMYKYFVIELSSFQLKGINKFTPKIAVITNVKQAHLDYHKSIEDYYNSKYNITKNQNKDDYLVLNVDCEMSTMLFKDSLAKKITYSLIDKKANCYYDKGRFYYNDSYICSAKILTNKTDTFKYDVMPAICVAKILNIENKYIIKALKNFTNIKYRLEEIYPKIYNDAKSTNIYSTIVAINEFKESVFLICGGYDRMEDLSGLDNNLTNISKVFTYGQTSEKVYNFFNEKEIDVYSFKTLKEATTYALSIRKNEIILYSPMFASYDQYKSYEERGKEFSLLIKNHFEI